MRVGFMLAAAAFCALTTTISASPLQAEPRYSALELARILAPAPAEPTVVAARLPRLRGLHGGEGVAQAALPSPAPGQPGSGVVPDLWLFFPFGSAELTPATRTQLDELGRALRDEELADLRFLVSGHTDAAGDEGYNERLSRQRAEAVVGYLRGAHGIARQRLEGRGYGESQLAAPEDPLSERNRRVEIRTLVR